MYLIFHDQKSKNRIGLNVNTNKNVKYLKKIISFALKLEPNENQALYLNYAGKNLKDDSIILHLNLPAGSIVKYYIDSLDLIKITDFCIYIQFQKRIIELNDAHFDPEHTFVFEIRLYLSNRMGLPLSLFRLKNIHNTVMFDEHKLIDYKITTNSQIIMETWHDWDLFLDLCIKGNSNKLIELLNGNELIREYQIKVALYIATFYLNHDLVNEMILFGARPDEPVGFHPSRMWCQNLNKRLEYLKCPIHVAAEKANLKILLLMLRKRVYMLEKSDGFKRNLWQLALENNKEVAKFILLKRASLKFNISKEHKISLFLYAKIKYWIESAQEKCLIKYGFNYTSLKYRPFYKSSLIGNKVLIDGYNNDFKENIIKLPIINNNLNDRTNQLKLNSLLNEQKMIKNETLKLFEKYNLGYDATETAEYYLEKMLKLDTKSWLQKIELSSKLAKENVKYRLRNKIY